MTVAETILEQIKGTDKWALSAWGAKQYLADETSLQFTVSGSKFKGKVIITLTPDDLYNVRFYKMNPRTLKVTVDETAEDVYFHMLVSIIDERIG